MRFSCSISFIVLSLCLGHTALAQAGYGELRRDYAPPVARSVEQLSEAYLDPSPEFVADRYDYVSTYATDFVKARRARLYAKADSGRVIAELKRGEGVHLLRRKGDWTLVRTRDRRVGYVATETLSNVWVLVSKSKHMVFVYHGTELIAKMPADFAINILGDKIQRGSEERPEDWRTPEGIFYVTGRNPNSQFYRALVINYPSPRHAKQGLGEGLISRREYADIVKSAMVFRSPPMNTPLGGWIEFHGLGVEGKANWTHGCIALENQDIDTLWDLVDVGTPVLIQPYKPRLYDTEPSRVDPQPIVGRTELVPSHMLR